MSLKKMGYWISLSKLPTTNKNGRVLCKCRSQVGFSFTGGQVLLERSLYTACSVRHVGVENFHIRVYFQEVMKGTNSIKKPSFEETDTVLSKQDTREKSTLAFGAVFY